MLPTTSTVRNSSLANSFDSCRKVATEMSIAPARGRLTFSMFQWQITLAHHGLVSMKVSPDSELCVHQYLSQNFYTVVEMALRREYILSYFLHCATRFEIQKSSLKAHLYLFESQYSVILEHCVKYTHQTVYLMHNSNSKAFARGCKRRGISGYIGHLHAQPRSTAYWRIIKSHPGSCSHE